ncbi:MAG: baseplate multidomain protein megatron [Rhizobiaceae bacterium]
MATLVLQAAGAFLGGAFGAVGAAIGSAVGATAGYLVDRALIESTRHVEGPRLATARPFTAEEGASIARIYGTARAGGTLIWATRFEEKRTTKRQGAKGGPKVTIYSYFANAAFVLCEGEIAGVRRIWADGRELDRTKFDIRIYEGGEDQLVDPLIEAKQGAANAPAYRGVAYAVFERFPLDDYGNRIPQFQFEVMRPCDDLNRQIRAVTLIPGSTEYGLEPDAVTLRIRKGETQPVNRHVLTAASDFAASLDELQALCPNLENVALVVAWFGDDLRAVECKVRPAVTQANPSGLSQDWMVSGVSREHAVIVSTHDGAPAFGGTPSDRSVLDAIADIKARGLKVTLYPFVMMDVPAGNALPDPYGGEAQAAYLWRGRITSMVAPGQPGTTDKTSAVTAEIEAFCGAAAVGDFEASSDTIRFTGAVDDWGYRRFVLHYASLAAAAGGIDAFLIGSELRGLTTLRDQANAFPFVERLCSLAADVRSVLGPTAKITYGADWSEYFGYHPGDGSGDVFFHLDDLWAHEAIDAVGIDNYMPLSDWRDADYAGGNPDGFEGPYDPDGLRAAIAGGEGFDWYYAGDDDRKARQRSPILDGAYGKPWTFRFKDLVGWWSNAHFNRIGGVEAATATAWIPGGKPIWFTEIGCPAVDKGPNQPNVFPDPKSSESASPHFSSGGRSDLAQQRFLEAHGRYWNPDDPDFEDAANPTSSVYGGRMVDFSRLYAWAWDARPYPAFPLLRDVWSDGDNWSLGHWLNGRLSGVSLSGLIAAILADHGLPQPDVAKADGFLTGYVVSDPSSARSALQPLVDLYGLAVHEDDGVLVFRSPTASAVAPLEIADTALDGNAAAIERTRAAEDDLPASAALFFQDGLRDYQSASARVLRDDALDDRERSLALPAIMDASAAEALVADWLRRAWQGRETIGLAVPAAAAGPQAGSIVRVSGSADEFLVTEIDEGVLRRLSARRLWRVAPTPGRPTLPFAAVAAGAVIGEPQVEFIDLPMISDGAPEDQLRVAVWANPWKTQALYVSPEDTGFALRASVSAPAVIGELLEPLAPGFAGRIVSSAEISVRLSDGELQSVSELQLLNGANAAAIHSQNGAWELVQFLTAEETAPSVWRLSGLLRGQLGTDDAMAAGAAAGASFVLLDEAVSPAGLLSTEIGLSLNWRVGPSGEDFSGPSFGRYTETGGLRALTPLSPVHLKALSQPGGDLELSWIRRGRIDADSWLAAEIPLGEETEAYQVDIAADGGSTVRSVTVSSPSWTYPADAFAEDFPVPPDALRVTVRQVSAAVGPGLPASATFPLG